MSDSIDLILVIIAFVFAMLSTVVTVLILLVQLGVIEKLS
jgi:hypothetical protein